ncbi:hypothetical protein TAL182_CH04208 [Rhizobium sp. TAL182]|nr:hypothetical protein TAL182_CH04208 [Rhizobium sp. TAL182]
MDGDPASFSSRYVQAFLLLNWLEKSFYQSLCQVRKGFLMQFDRWNNKRELKEGRHGKGRCESTRPDCNASFIDRATGQRLDNLIQLMNAEQTIAVRTSDGGSDSRG